MRTAYPPRGLVAALTPRWLLGLHFGVPLFGLGILFVLLGSVRQKVLVRLLPRRHLCFLIPVIIQSRACDSKGPPLQDDPSNEARFTNISIHSSHSRALLKS